MDRHTLTAMTRRGWLSQVGSGLGWCAVADLWARQTRAEDAKSPASAAPTAGPLAAKSPHFPPRAKRVIMMFMQGAPSQIDLLDPKPALAKLAETTKGAASANGRLFPSPWKFQRSGQSGLAITELLPNVASHADSMCILNGMYTDNPAHPQATIMMHTGAINFVRPSMGSWIVYGLGSENADLPGFVSINPDGNPGGAQNYGSAFLPAAYQGTRVQAGDAPIANIRNRRLSRAEQRRHLDLLQAMNQDAMAASVPAAELEGIIESYELAFRMQSSVPELMDIAQEPDAVRERYGINDRASADFGMQCLMARRLAEADVRFIEITQRGWDQHNNLKNALPRNCQAIDRPIAALIQDLKDRDLLRDTLLVWTGEFGRTPQEQNNFDGRRHNHRGFSAWLAGAGVRGGFRHGMTDETGAEAVDGKVHVHDLHATILHLLGLDHERLTYRYSGRDFRLTDVKGQVVKEILA